MTTLKLIDKTILEQINNDLERADRIWTNLFEKYFGDSIKYLFRKGSTVKGMKYRIDYVPVLSDADLHFTFKENLELSDFFDDPVKSSLEIAKEYNHLYTDYDYFHIPRMQILDTTKLKTLVDFVPTPKSDVKMLIGDYNPPDLNTKPEEIRKIDRDNLHKLKEDIDNFPSSFIDRGGLDFWTGLRRMTWKISPTPIRLLTHSHDNPIKCWSWGRSQVYQELISNGFEEIARWYNRYYSLGWDLFEKDFNDIDLYSEILYAGYKVLHTTYNEFQKINS